MAIVRYKIIIEIFSSVQNTHVALRLMKTTCAYV